jgi:hypothetical protein
MTETDIRLAVNIARRRLKDFGISTICTDVLRNVRATTVTDDFERWLASGDDSTFGEWLEREHPTWREAAAQWRERYRRVLIPPLTAPRGATEQGEGT